MSFFLPYQTTINRKLILVLTFLIVFPFISRSQTSEIPIKATGFTEDVIADPTIDISPMETTTNPVDIPPGDVFYVKGYSRDSEVFNNGLPANGILLSNGNHPYQLQPYDQMNSLRLIEFAKGTLTFDADFQRNYLDLSLLVTAGSGFPMLEYIIHYKDQTSDTGQISLEDWLCEDCTFYAIKDIGRVDREYGTDQGNQFAMYEYPILIKAEDQSKIITSIDFMNLTADEGVINIFAITGVVPAPEILELKYFNVQQVNSDVLLQWETGAEYKNKQFILERALVSQPDVFNRLGTVLSVSANGAVYTFTDVSPNSGNYIYRLSQQLTDQSINILASKTIVVTNDKSWQIRDMGNMWTLYTPEQANYRLVDMMGRVVIKSSGNGSININKPASHGLYELQIEIGGKKYNQKLIK